MPPKRSRAATRVTKRKSYAEISSDEDSIGSSEDYSSDHEASSPVVRKRSKRIANTASSPEPSDSQRPSRNATRRKAQISYKDIDTDEEGLDIAAVSEEEAPPPKRRRLAPQRSTTARAPIPQRRLQYPVQKPNLPSQSKPETQQVQVILRRVRRPPFWETLPYHIWVEIFEYASCPLYNATTFERYDTKRWLLAALTLCKHLLEPALTVLYKPIPFTTIEAPHLLCDLLNISIQDRPSTKILAREINHAAKVQRLEMDVGLLNYSMHHRGRFDLGSLIPLVPQLNTIRLSNKYDSPMGRKHRRTVKWSYPDNLFTAIATSGNQLRSFQWNRSMFTKDQDLAWMRSMHEVKAFQTIKELKLCGFEAKEVRRKDVDTTQAKTPEELLADAISALPELKELEFESCSALNEILLPLLPQGLEVLRINDCAFFDGAMLAASLASHGSELKELILLHNKALDLSFLPTLKSSCPKLQVLHVDLNNYNSHRTYVDSKPTYIDLLREDEIPTWPSSLRTIEMLYLREWSDNAAISFFRSLVDAAEELPELRTLRVKAILSLGWKERIGFREEWVSRLQRVFLRKSIPPNKHFTSIAEGREYLDKQHRTAGEVEIVKKDKDPLAAIISQKNVIDRDHGSDSESAAETVPQKSGRRKRLPTPTSDSQSQRKLRPRRTQRQYDEDSSSDTEPEQKPTSLAAATKAALENYIQGMCDVVEVSIDNLRPAEKQFSEGDFLDSEPDDDGDWDGRDEGEYFEGWQT